MNIMFTGLRLIITALGLACLPFFVKAQSYSRKENNIWLNNGEGISLNSGMPLPLASSWQSHQHAKGSASVCDAAGKLLFYTDGNIVWNRNNDVMQGGWDINNNGGLAANTYFIEPVFGISSYTFDGVVIVPMPGSNHKYYVFSSPMLWTENSIGLYDNTWEGKLYATVVDMERNNGLGGIVPEYRGRIIAGDMAGNLHAVTGEDCNYWLLGFGSDGAYKAFTITADSVTTTPVVSTLTPPLSPFVSELNVSPDRKRAALALSGEVQVTDFDPATGMFSNDVIIGAQSCNYVAFSPNSNLIYFSGLIGIRQYDLTSLTTPFTLLTFNNITAFEYNAPLRLASNNRIYLSYSTDVPGSGTQSVAAHIQQPDIFGTGCQMALIPGQSLPLMENNWVIDYAFPNEIPVMVYDTVSVKKNVALCFGKPVLLEPSAGAGTDYHWMINTAGYTFLRSGTDTTASLLATTAGKYALQYFTSNPCVLHRDTFYVNSVSFSLYLGPDQVSCDGKSITLEADVPGADILWPDGSTGNTYEADTSGAHWVAATREGCTARDTIDLKIFDIRQDLGNDTTICIEDKGFQLTLDAAVPPDGAALWNTGSTASSIHIADSGLYWVKVTSGGCESTDSFFLHQAYCDCPLLFPTAFSPNGDGNNDTYMPVLPASCPVNNYKLQIYNRWGQMIFVSYKQWEGWNGSYNGLPADAGSYRYQLRMTTGLRKNKLIKAGDFLLIR